MAIYRKENGNLVDKSNLDASAISEIKSSLTPIDILASSGASGVNRLVQMGKIVMVSLEKNITSPTHGQVIASGLPRPFTDIYVGLGAGAISYSAKLDTNGNLSLYYPTTTNSRIDASFMYFTA